MRKVIYIFLFVLALVLFSGGIKRVFAQDLDVATISAESSMSAKLASSSALIKKIVEKKPDLTQDKPSVTGKLERYLNQNPLSERTPFNFIQYNIRDAVANGVPVNTIVLLLLFPLVAAVVVIARHIIGLRSFGIFTPALLAVAFLNTGLTTGLLLLFLILTVATIIRILLKKTRIQYLPRMAIFMWFISLSLLGLLLLSPILNMGELIKLGIFPILILIISVENFLDVQITRSFSQAIAVTLETLIVAFGCFFLMNMEFLQKFVLLNPEFFILAVLILVFIVERYSGLRLMEYWRFRKIIK